MDPVWIIPVSQCSCRSQEHTKARSFKPQHDTEEGENGVRGAESSSSCNVSIHTATGFQGSLTV